MLVTSKNAIMCFFENGNNFVALISEALFMNQYLVSCQEFVDLYCLPPVDFDTVSSGL